MDNGDPIRVPSVDAMSAETFRLHLNARHISEGDFASLTGLSGDSTFAANERTFRTYHAHLHRRREYPHVHVE